MALAKFVDEDPTLRVKYDDETAQTVISGMGELHLEIIIDRLIREFNAHVNVGKPRVVYRETIQKSVELDGAFERELGDRRHYGFVRLRLEPLERGMGNDIVNRIDPAQVPEEFHQAIIEGIREAIFSGTVAGYPVIDVRVTLLGGLHRDSESSQLGYKIAASTAFRGGFAQADPVLLEPIMLVDILSPSEFMGEVIGDINARRGEVQAITPRGPISEIRAKVPLRAMFGYSTDLRSATQGRATFSMHFLEFGKSGS